MHRIVEWELTWQRMGLLLLACGLAWCWASPSQAESSRDHIAASTWWPRIHKVEEVIDKGRWKSAAKQAQRLEEEVLGRSWHGSELRKVLTEVAFLQALAYANLDQDRRAVWYWHTAINLDFRVARRDIRSYGKAARLLLEFPLRRRGDIPAGFDPSPTTMRAKVKPAQWPRMNATPIILNNTGAALEHHGDFHVEVIIDEQGRPHHTGLDQ